MDWTDRESVNAWKRDWYSKNRERVLAQQRRWNTDNHRRKLEHQRVWYVANKELIAQRTRERASEQKRKTINAYGKACQCCGEGELAFLTIDHVNGGGTEHRKTLGKQGAAFYRWLEKQGYPPGYQALCMNCNWARRFSGVCPHQEKTS